MRICVISDTHIPDRYEELPAQLVSEIKKSDLVIHAGDFTSFELYQQIKHLKPLKAVLGNMDASELREHLKDKETFNVKNFKIGIMHGYGKPEMIIETVKENFGIPSISSSSDTRIRLIRKNGARRSISTPEAPPTRSSPPTIPSGSLRSTQTCMPGSKG